MFPTTRKLIIIIACEDKKPPRQYKIKLQQDRDLHELQDLLIEALGSPPSILTICDDKDGISVGTAEYYNPIRLHEIPCFLENIEQLAGKQDRQVTYRPKNSLPVQWPEGKAAP